MKKYVASVLITLIAGASSSSLAALSRNNACPDLAGTYQTEDGATFLMTSTETPDGYTVFGYDRDTWVVDRDDSRIPRDSHTGALNPKECPSLITCGKNWRGNKVLTRSYTCFGMTSVEEYSLEGKNIKVSGKGMGLQGDHVYTRVSN